MSIYGPWSSFIQTAETRQSGCKPGASGGQGSSAPSPQGYPPGPIQATHPSAHTPSPLCRPPSLQSPISGRQLAFPLCEPAFFWQGAAAVCALDRKTSFHQ